VNPGAVARLTLLGASESLLGLHESVVEPVIQHVDHLCFRPSVTT
jgi:hypothetical protein